MTADLLRRAAVRAQELADERARWTVTIDGVSLDACDPPFLRAVGELLAGLAATEPWDFRHDEALAVARALLGES